MESSKAITLLRMARVKRAKSKICEWEIIGWGQNANSSTRNKRVNVKTRSIYIRCSLFLATESARKRWEGKGMNGKASVQHALEFGFPGCRLRIVSKFSSKRWFSGRHGSPTSRISGFDVPLYGIGKGKYKLSFCFVFSIFERLMRQC